MQTISSMRERTELAKCVQEPFTFVTFVTFVINSGYEKGALGVHNTCPSVAEDVNYLECRLQSLEPS